jgi:predicted nucleic acid-binding protein
MTSAADPLFVDTNVLVYASWAAAPLHAHSRSVLATHHSTGAPLYIRVCWAPTMPQIRAASELTCFS